MAFDTQLASMPHNSCNSFLRRHRGSRQNSNRCHRLPGRLGLRTRKSDRLEHKLQSACRLSRWNTSTKRREQKREHVLRGAVCRPGCLREQTELTDDLLACCHTTRCLLGQDEKFVCHALHVFQIDRTPERDVHRRERLGRVLRRNLRKLSALCNYTQHRCELILRNLLHRGEEVDRRIVHLVDRRPRLDSEIAQPTSERLKPVTCCRDASSTRALKFTDRRDQTKLALDVLEL